MNISNLWNKIIRLFSKFRISKRRHTSKKIFIINSQVGSNSLNIDKKFDITGEKEIEPPSKFKITAKARPQVCPRCKSKKSAKRMPNGNLVCNKCDYNMGK